MKKRHNNLKKNILKYIILIIISTIVFYIYIGFYYTDPYGSARFGIKYSFLLWGIRIFIPIAVAYTVIIIINIKTKKISFHDAGLLTGSLIFALVLMYPIGNILFDNFLGVNGLKEKYHPYLQLSPELYSIDTTKHNKKIEIICLGGSTTEFKGKNGKGWPERVEKLINDGQNEEVVKIHNLGKQWYTTLHSLINYETNVKHNHLNIIIMMHGINDLLHNADFSYFSHSSFRQDYGHFYGPVERIIAGRSFWSEIWDKMNFWYHKPREIISLMNFPGLMSFERNINTLIDLADQDGVKIVLMTQPFLFKENMTNIEKRSLYMLNVEAVGYDKRWDKGTALRGMEAYNEKTREIAKYRNIFLIDLEKAVPKNLEYFWDDVHYTEKAFNLIAHFIHEELLRQNIIKK